VNMTALVPQKGMMGCKPELVSLKDMLRYFLEFRVEVTEKRLIFEKKKLFERIHILEGFVIIYDAIDEVIKIVRKSDGRQDSAEKIQKRFKLTEIQSFAIVDMKIHQLSKTSIDEIQAELAAKQGRVTEIDKILGSKKAIQKIIKDELAQIAEKFGDKRKSDIVKDKEGFEIEFDESAYIVKEDVYALITTDGWIKRIRQGNEISGTRLREGDALFRSHALNTVDSVAVFTNLGNIYSLSVSDFPSSSGYGSPVQKILKFKDGEKIIESFSILAADRPVSAQGELFAGVGPTIKDNDTVLLVSATGMGSATKIEGLAALKKSGKRIMKLRDGDETVAVCHKTGNISMVTKTGHGLTIKSDEVPEREGAAVGVIVMGLKDGDRVVSALQTKKGAKLSLVLESGSNKDVEISEFAQGHRGLKGKKVIPRGEVKTAKIL
ncbi:MAG: DNA gyrase subunit A, partial [bacterium]|nr:DNA gyrase subunit A [bacterium]